MRPRLVGVILAVVGGGVALPAVAHADNTRLNNSVIANVYTIQHQAGCTNDVAVSPQLRLAAEWHANDVLNNRDLDGDLGSDGSTPQTRAQAAGFRGKVFQTVAINRSIAINNLDVLNQWYYDPPTYAIMANCANTVMGVWSENSWDRSVVVAVYGQPGA
ncbi:CAP domain-containing protein [Mycolicibacterium mucogenicum]|uniref:CAP domain-containing protein n=1 Tax=Mycolicibacterium mucogenicum TaxID=56689 RepID=UPI00226AF01B|nr:CAP domain-containing protein [Mycolicibacterium mucogenicum]MCX8558890.1 CAP domain-containing protein [Mycolicibacterium mucogenicum]